MRHISERERKHYLRHIWARANEVFADRELADVMLHNFIYLMWLEESLKHLSVGQYEDVLSWLQFARARLDILRGKLPPVEALTSDSG